MGYNWSFDAPTGVYKNHALSSKLRSAAIAETKFMSFVDTEEGYGKGRGESITITRVSNMTVPSNGRITESQKVPEDDLTLTTVAVTVVEWARSVPFTSFAQDLSKFDPENIIQRELMKQMRLTLDNGAAAEFTSSSAKVKAIPDGASSLTFDTDGTASTTATVNLAFYHVEQIRDYMFSTLNVPPRDGDDYISLVSTKAKRGVMSDTAFEDWNKYTDPSKKYNSEVGRLENCRFIEINNTNALSGSLGSGGVLGEAVFFGQDAVTMAMAQDPELRAELPGDYGRKQSLAWYGILEFGVVWDTATAGEARIVHVTSA
jgi:N4-gp56 family major capsid protein